MGAGGSNTSSGKGIISSAVDADRQYRPPLHTTHHSGQFVQVGTWSQREADRLTSQSSNPKIPKFCFGERLAV
jgi:hypothetical protein